LLGIDIGFGKRRVVERPRVNDRCFSSLLLELMLRLDNLRSDGALRWKAEDHRLGRSKSVMWNAGTSKFVSPACVGYGPMGWPLRVSIERTDRMLEIWAW
jgi:hypothetical protein